MYIQQKVDMSLDDLNFNIQTIQHRIERLESLADRGADVSKQIEPLYEQLDRLLEQRRNGGVN